MNRRERILVLEILECKTALVFGKLLLYLDGLRKVTFKGKRVEICMYNTIYMHIDIKVIFDPNTLSYMESETKKE